MDDNRAPLSLGNGHLDTLLPYLFRPLKKQAYSVNGLQRRIMIFWIWTG